MSSGLAPLASRVGGTAETISDATNGALFERDDEDGVRAAVRRFESDPALAARLGAAARAEVEACYALDRVVARLETLYRGGE
jgi:glycosyltransferase involved in cell wall biosynthesis